MNADSQLKTLATLQQIANESKKIYEAALSQIAPLRADMDKKAQELQQAEKELKELLLSDLIENGVEPNLPGVHITHQTKMRYEQEHAVIWAINGNVEEVLTIKKSAFNEIVKNMEVPPVFISFERVPAIAISNDLKTILAREESTGKTTTEQLLPEALK